MSNRTDSRASSFAATRFVAASSLLAIALAFWTSRPAAADKADPKSTTFEAIRALTGTWVATTPAEAGKKPMTLVFKPTSGGSAILETMAPGTDEEMVNVYTADDKGVTLTHYCHMGNQPRMRATSIDKGVVQFDFVDGGNLKSRDEAHMDSLQITIEADHLTEKWTMYHDGKPGHEVKFEFKRQG